MRKIISKEESSKKKRTNQIIVGTLLVFVMIFSTLGYAFMGGDETSKETNEVNYNGYKLISNGNSWVLTLGDYQFGFLKKPSETSAEISGELKLLNNYVNKPFYISSQDNYAASEIYKNLGQVASRWQFACIDNKDCDKDYPIKNCSSNFIILKTGNSNSISQQDNCVFIQSNNTDLIGVSDEFLYKVLGVK